jgi:hypothetical protein
MGIGDWEEDDRQGENGCGFWGVAGGFFGGTALTISTSTRTGHVAITYGSLSSLIHLA